MRATSSLESLPVPCITTVLTPDERLRVDAAGDGIYRAWHRDTMNDALREVMLEGKSLLEVSWRIGILLAFAVVTFALALRWFKWR